MQTMASVTDIAVTVACLLGGIDRAERTGRRRIRSVRSSLLNYIGGKPQPAHTEQSFRRLTIGRRSSKLCSC
jgi:hypothetical protein